MRRRETAEAPFLERPVQTWERLCRRRPHIPQILMAMAGLALAKAGELRPDEVARLEAIAAGKAEHARIDADHAASILAAMPSRRGISP